MEQRRRGGLRPGQTHSGSFKKGDDPRRTGGAKLYDGMTLAQMCRLEGPRSVALLVRARDDDSVPMPTRIRAAELILDRGYGKAISTIEMQVTHTRELRSLSRDELKAIAAGETPRLPVTIDGQAIDVTPLAVPSSVPADPQDVDG